MLEQLDNPRTFPSPEYSAIVLTPDSKQNKVDKTPSEILQMENTKLPNGCLPTYHSVWWWTWWYYIQWSHDNNYEKNWKPFEKCHEMSSWWCYWRLHLENDYLNSWDKSTDYIISVITTWVKFTVTEAFWRSMGVQKRRKCICNCYYTPFVIVIIL